MVSSSYGVFYLWATVSFTNSNLARKSHCEEREDINAKFYPFINGEGEKVSWKLWKISLSVKHSFYTFFPLEGCVDLQKEGQSGYARQCIHLAFCFLADYWGLFPSNNLNPSETLRCNLCPAQYTLPCRTGSGMGTGTASGIASSCRDFLVQIFGNRITFWKWFFDVFLLRAWGL